MRRWMGSLIYLAIAVCAFFLAWKAIPTDGDVSARGTIRSIAVQTDLDEFISIDEKPIAGGGTQVTFTDYGHAIAVPGHAQTIDGVTVPDDGDADSLQLVVPIDTWGSADACAPGAECEPISDDSSSRPDLKFVDFTVPLKGQGMMSYAAQLTFTVPTAETFGYPAVWNSEHVAAFIPAVSVHGPAPDNAEGPPATGATVRITYHIPGAAAFDWRTGPPPTSGGSTVTWTASEAEGLAQAWASGVDASVQGGDSIRIFVSGALVGVAGGVLVAFIQGILEVSPTGKGPRTRP